MAMFTLTTLITVITIVIGIGTWYAAARPLAKKV